MDFDHIIKLSPEILYEKALEFRQLQDYDNYCMHIIMAANHDYKLAIDAYCNNGNFNFFQKQNYLNTKKFYKMTQNYGFSAYYLAHMYEYGCGVSKHYGKAKKLYEMAIIKDNTFAMNSLAWLYCYSSGVTQNLVKARELYELAIENGCPDALENLTNMYEEDNIKNDTEYAINYFSKINKLEQLKKIYGYNNYDTVN